MSLDDKEDCKNELGSDSNGGLTSSAVKYILGVKQCSKGDDGGRSVV
jgi:hypothetical protein